MKCNKCEYWDKAEGVCGAFECNGMECPDLPCEEWWIFTFGSGQKHAGKYVKIQGTHGQAREKMIKKYGLEWAFQYSEKKWREMEEDPWRCYTMETELEVIGNEAD